MKMEAKKIYLANTTLIVVPQILIKQWRSEIVKHVEEGYLKIKVVGKEELGVIEELIDYDVR
jgi:N12 class adenine-specific DNA methylase